MTDAALREAVRAAAAALTAGDVAGATRQADAVCAAAPGVGLGWLLAGRARMAAGQVDAAVPLLREAVARLPQSAEAWAALAGALQALGRVEEPFRCYEQALRLAPDDAGVLARVGGFLLERGAVADAEACFRQACAGGRTDGAPGWLRVLELRGDVAGAQALIDRYATLLGTHAAFTTSAARALIRAGQAARARDALDALPPSPFRATTVAIEHARGDVLEALGDAAGAFDAHARAHAARGLRWDAEAHSRRVDALCRDWTRARLAPPAPPADPGSDAVFILGLPRSGTTLLEQILASHPDVRTCGELDDLPDLARGLPDDADAATLDAAAARYLARLRRDGRATRILDKLPANALALHAAARMLPGARVIALDRDPMDACASCFSKDFAATLAWTTDLYALGRYAADHARLLDHWRRALPLAWLDVRYEDLVNDPEAEVRRVLTFLGLGFDPACLRFFERRELVHTASYAQVRRPIHREAVGRAAAVADRLGPLRQGLADGQARAPLR